MSTCLFFFIFYLKKKKKKDLLGHTRHYLNGNPFMTYEVVFVTLIHHHFPISKVKRASERVCATRLKRKCTNIFLVD